MRIDARSSTAVDRFVFTEMQSHDRIALDSGISAASRYLAKQPNDAAILQDRALCLLLEKGYVSALSDYERAASLTNDPREYLFAGYAAYHAHRLKLARTLWRRALQINARFRPAATALRRLAW